MGKKLIEVIGKGSFWAVTYIATYMGQVMAQVSIDQYHDWKEMKRLEREQQEYRMAA